MFYGGEGCQHPKKHNKYNKAFQFAISWFMFDPHTRNQNTNSKPLFITPITASGQLNPRKYTSLYNKHFVPFQNCISKNKNPQCSYLHSTCRIVIKKTYHFFVACIDMKDAIPKICVKDVAPKSDD